MSTQISLRLPSKLLEKIDVMSTEEDKPRTQIIVSLLEEMMRLRDHKLNEKSKPENKTEEEKLRDKCGLEYILEIKHMVSEVLRYTYPHARSEFENETKTADATMAFIAANVQSAVQKFMPIRKVYVTT